LLLSVFTIQAQAGSIPRKAEPALIRYLGIRDDMAVFNISYNNPAGAAFDLSVMDQDGSELYRHTFYQQGFHKQFRLPRAGKSKFSFVIANGREREIVKTFGINVRKK
jgi:hypothetical protein